jgi:hypothetical protein
MTSARNFWTEEEGQDLIKSGANNYDVRTQLLE